MFAIFLRRGEFIFNFSFFIINYSLLIINYYLFTIIRRGELTCGLPRYVTGLSFRHLYQNGFYTFTLSGNFVDYYTIQRDSLLNPLFLNESIETENKFKFENIFKPTKTSEISLGATLSLIQFDANIFFPNFLTSFGDTLPLNTLNTEKTFYKSSLFFNYNLFSGVRFVPNTGIRFDYFDAIENKFYFSPRASLSYL